jgi:outer membrane lipoprotein-sorting protein
MSTLVLIGLLLLLVAILGILGCKTRDPEEELLRKIEDIQKQIDNANYDLNQLGCKKRICDVCTEDEDSNHYC